MILPLRPDVEDVIELVDEAPEAYGDPVDTPTPSMAEQRSRRRYRRGFCSRLAGSEGDAA